MAGSRKTNSPRSAWGKIANRLSSSFGSTWPSPSARPRLRLISIRAFSFASGFTSSRRLDEPEETSSRDMTVECAGRRLVVDHLGRAGLRPLVRPPAGRAMSRAAGSGPCSRNSKTTSHSPIWSPFAEPLPSADRHAVQQRAVAAVQVLDVELVADAEDAGVLAADGPGVQHDVAVRVPAEDRRLLLQREDLARRKTLNCQQYGHICHPPGVSRERTRPAIAQPQILPSAQRQF